MSIGKFKISEYCISIIGIIILILGALYFTIQEEQIKAKKEQLQLELDIQRTKLEQIERKDNNG